MSGDDLSSENIVDSEEEENAVTRFGFAGKETLKLDHRQFDHTKYEKLYKWLYFNQVKKGFMCKICEVYGDTPTPIHGFRGAWSHKRVAFKDIPSKKLRRHQKSADHKKTILAKTNLSVKDSIQVVQNEDRSHANELYIGKLVQIVQFLARNNLSVKSLYPKFVDFLANELQEPIIKQYLDICSKNATYSSHETCHSLVQAIQKYYLEKAKECIKQSTDIVIFADESTYAARKEMLGIFTGSFDESNKEFKMDFITLTEVSSTKSKTVMKAIECTLRKNGIDIMKTRFTCLDGTNSMPSMLLYIYNIS